MGVNVGVEVGIGEDVGETVDVGVGEAVIMGVVWIVPQPLNNTIKNINVSFRTNWQYFSMIPAPFIT